MKLTTLAIITTLSAPFAMAAGSHDGGHSHKNHEEADHKTPDSAAEHGHTEGHDHATDHMGMMEVGMPGDPADVTRTVEIRMVETDDGEMLFEPDDTTIETLAFEAGETVLFKITNEGELDHEFVLDTIANNEKHRELMQKFPEMEHDDPNSITLAPGETGEIAWTFANRGDFQFACLIPGHMEAGMHGPIEVAQAETERTFTKGVVKKIKADAGKVTIIHEELTELDMPAMTMVFRAEDDIISQMSEGQEIEFVAERVQGKLTVVRLK